LSPLCGRPADDWSEAPVYPDRISTAFIEFHGHQIMLSRLAAVSNTRPNARTAEQEGPGTATRRWTWVLPSADLIFGVVAEAMRSKPNAYLLMYLDPTTKV